jgi:hypothetical protein
MVLYVMVYGLAMMIVGLAAQMLLGAKATLPVCSTKRSRPCSIRRARPISWSMLAAIHGQLTATFPARSPDPAG